MKMCCVCTHTHYIYLKIYIYFYTEYKLAILPQNLVIKFQ